MNLVFIPFVLITVMTFLHLSGVTYSVEFCAIPLQSQWVTWNYSCAACMHKGLRLCFLTLLYWTDDFNAQTLRTKDKVSDPIDLSLLPFQARMVAAATSNLCEAANASVQGHASEEKLISSAKQVAASTAQLLVACKVKADQDSEAMRRLQVQTPSSQHTAVSLATKGFSD